MAEDKIIGINDANGLLNSKNYLASIAKKTDAIMGETYEMNTDKLLANKDFQSIFTKAENVNMEDVKSVVKDIVGKEITKRELNMILVLMDAELQNVKGKKKIYLSKDFYKNIRKDKKKIEKAYSIKIMLYA